MCQLLGCHARHARHGWPTTEGTRHTLQIKDSNFHVLLTYSTLPCALFPCLCLCCSLQQKCRPRWCRHQQPLPLLLPLLLLPLLQPRCRLRLWPLPLSKCMPRARSLWCQSSPRPSMSRGDSSHDGLLATGVPGALQVPVCGPSTGSRCPGVLQSRAFTHCVWPCRPVRVDYICANAACTIN